MAKKKKISHLDLVLEDLRKYNKEHGTDLTYGQYKSLIRIGKIKPVFHGWRCK